MIALDLYCMWLDWVPPICEWPFWTYRYGVAIQFWAHCAMKLMCLMSPLSDHVCPILNENKNPKKIAIKFVRLIEWDLSWIIIYHLLLDPMLFVSFSVVRVDRVPTLPMLEPISNSVAAIPAHVHYQTISPDSIELFRSLFRASVTAPLCSICDLEKKEKFC